MVELTQEEIQELNQHDIEKIWPSDEAVATAASRLNREWNPFLSRAQTNEPDNGKPNTESQGVFTDSTDSTTSTGIISINTCMSHDNQERSHDDPFKSRRLQGDFTHQTVASPNSMEAPETFHGNATPATCGSQNEKMPEDRKETYSGFSMTNNLLDSATVDSSLMNSVLDSANSHEPLWGGALGFGLIPQTTNDNSQSHQSGKGVENHMSIQDPAIIHVMSNPLSGMPEHQVGAMPHDTIGNGIKHKSTTNDQNQTVPPTDYDSHFNQAPFVPFPQESIHGNIDLRSMLPGNLTDSCSRASTPQQHSGDRDTPQQRCDTSDMHVVESSTRTRNMQGMKRPRCRPTVDVVPPREESPSSESEGEYEDASDVWDTGSSGCFR